MAFSSGGKQALSEAATWLVAGVCFITSVIYYDELKAATRSVFGLPSPAELSAGGAPSSHQKQLRPSARQTRGQSRSLASGTVELRAGRHGQYVTFAEINGQQAKVLVDTGATAVALTSDDAANAGIFLSASDYSVRVMTANGIGRAAPVMLDSVTIGDITIHDVRALVNQPGTLHISLLGMTFLNRLSKVDIGNGRMLLQE